LQGGKTRRGVVAGVQMARESRNERSGRNERGPELPIPANEDGEAAARRAALAGLDRKAEDVLILDVRGLSGYTDFLVLMTASSDRQVKAVADAVDDALKEAGRRPIGVEGQGSANWILIDTGDVIVHVFHTDARGFYDLDGLWSDARRIRVEPPRTAPAA